MSAGPAYQEIDAAPHRYRERTPTDRFTKMMGGLESGQTVLDRTGEKGFLTSLLNKLDIPASSQMLVFSTTSLQLSLISPSNPRAIYFNEDIYLGYVPGGRIEIVSLDPELGGIFYIFDIPRGEGPMKIERSGRCMNCHANADTGYVPGLVVKSVVPGPTGGSLTAYRLEQSGHGIPFEERFGGWHVTGKHGITNHWGNIIGRFSAGELIKRTIEPGRMFEFSRYPVATSDVLPQLLLEHQTGFVNRVVEAAYRARTILQTQPGNWDAAQKQELEEQARLVTRYILFADEVPLPAPGVEGDGDFRRDFLRNRKAGGGGASLKDFDLKTRLFKHRCSYMIYSPVFTGLPKEMKERIYLRMREALSIEKPAPEYGYLPPEEKRAISEILKETLADYP